MLGLFLHRATKIIYYSLMLANTMQRLEDTSQELRKAPLIVRTGTKESYGYDKQ